jgi:hypothetical protein
VMSDHVAKLNLMKRVLFISYFSGVKSGAFPFANEY